MADISSIARRKFVRGTIDMLSCNYYTTCVCVHWRLIEGCKTHDPNMIWKSISLAKVQKTLEAHGYKSCIAKLSIIPHTLAILTANIAHCIILLEYVNESQVNMHIK